MRTNTAGTVKMGTSPCNCLLVHRNARVDIWQVIPPLLNGHIDL